VLLLALAIPLVAVPAAAYFVVSGGGGGARAALAPGAVGGTFHPIAGTFVADDTELAECGGEWSCLEQAFGNLAFREGPRRALATFEERVASDATVEKDCHRIVHTIGSAALERFDGNVARTFAQGSPTCVSGYYHGILERAFQGVSTKGGLGKVARSLCLGAGLRRRGFLDYQCRHGLGHGLMIQTGYDLPLALSVCARLGTGWDRKACSSGAFMENVNTRFGYRSRWLSDDDPIYPCKRVAVLDRHSCYLRSSWRLLGANGFDYAKAGAACGALGVWAGTCYRGLGRDATEQARYDLDETQRLCRLAGPGEGACLLGAARTIANASGMPGVSTAAALCRRAPATARAECVSGVGLVLGMLYPTKAARRAACARITREHVDLCTKAAQAEVDPTGRDAWG
jgi:hypothetical protein